MEIADSETASKFSGLENRVLDEPIDTPKYLVEPTQQDRDEPCNSAEAAANMNLTKIFVPPAEAPQMLSIYGASLYGMVKRGELRLTLLGHRSLTRVSELHAFAQSMPTAAAELSHGSQQFGARPSATKLRRDAGPKCPVFAQSHIHFNSTPASTS